jgi:hypothetical protein
MRVTMHLPHGPHGNAGKHDRADSNHRARPNRNVATEMNAGGNVDEVIEACVMIDSARRVQNHTPSHAAAAANDDTRANHRAVTHARAAGDQRRGVLCGSESLSRPPQVLVQTCPPGVVSHCQDHGVMPDPRDGSEVAQNRSSQAILAFQLGIVIDESNHVDVVTGNALRLKDVGHHLAMAARPHNQNLHRSSAPRNSCAVA